MTLTERNSDMSIRLKFKYDDLSTFTGDPYSGYFMYPPGSNVRTRSILLKVGLCWAARLRLTMPKPFYPYQLSRHWVAGTTQKDYP